MSFHSFELWDYVRLVSTEYCFMVLSQKDKYESFQYIFFLNYGVTHQK